MKNWKLNVHFKQILTWQIFSKYGDSRAKSWSLPDYLKCFLFATDFSWLEIKNVIFIALSLVNRNLTLFNKALKSKMVN